jgi:hypothetical protein
LEHITIDLSIKEVTTPDDATLRIIMVETNTPLILNDEDTSEAGMTFILGRAIQPHKPFFLDVKPFKLIILNCCDHWSCFVCAPANDPEESSFQMKLIENDKTLDISVPDAAFGMQCQFGFIGFINSQKVRIESLSNKTRPLAEEGDTN